MQYGEVTASYFWDTGTSINGDTGAPASGKPMQKGMAASPSWPLGTEGYVEYNGKKAEFFIGDRGPGHPAENCDILLDLDGKTFAELVGESWNEGSRTVTGGQGHIDIEYYVTEWGDGHGESGPPEPMSGSEVCDGKAVQPVPASAKDGGDEKKQEQDDGSQQASAQKSTDDGKSTDDENSTDGEGSGNAEKSGDENGQGEEGGDGESSQDESDEKDSQESGSQQADGSQSADEQDAAGSGGGDQGGSEQGLNAETAANDVSGISLVGNDTPVAAGVLTLAILPALLVAFLFARRRHNVDYASEGGRHRAQSLLSGEALRDAVQNVRASLPGAWSDTKQAAGDYWRRASRAARRGNRRRG
ncbi:hypothetical protein EKD16_16945 [Streptomonospora litoralis]|uniref:Uncharacterized protein n=1 Tax=Streptomonospora litoralis TaxID=2498135 RepID=A0A4P6Q3A4_9ACTN|nr:hypothetical protein EKD16_16945 [Streptomonospora litoralis]